MRGKTTTKGACFVLFLCVDLSLSVLQAWVQLFNSAQSTIEIVSYHWGLQRGSGRGLSVFDAIAQGWRDQGTPTEREGSVQLASLS